MKKIVIVLITIIFLTAALVYFFLRGNEGGLGGFFPTPTPFQQKNTYEAVPAAENDPAGAEQASKSMRVGSLIEQLPYNGQNFSLSYSFSRNEFILFLNPNSSGSADKEFNSFLSQRGIEDRSWIENLVITSVKVTPEL